MKKTLIVTILVFVWATVTVPAASAFLIRIPLYSPEIQGEDTGAGAAIEIKLRNKNDNLKAWVFETADSAGDFWANLPSGVRVMPGDSIDVWVNAVQYSISNFSEIDITKISPNKDVVAGRVKPRKGSLEIHVEGGRLRDTGWEDVENDKTVTTAPDGTFRTKLGFNLKRTDQVYVGYVDGDFAVYNRMIAPGLQMGLGGGAYAMAGGRKGTSYQVRLMDKNGKVKSTCSTFVATFTGGGALIEFSKPGGKPVSVKKGDRIRLAGKWGFTDKVEPLKLDVDIVGDTFTVKAKPNGLVGLSLRDVSVYQSADANGDLSFNWWTQRGMHVNARDNCELIYQDKQGNVYYIGKQAL